VFRHVITNTRDGTEATATEHIISVPVFDDHKTLTMTATSFSGTIFARTASFGTVRRLTSQNGLMPRAVGISKTSGVDVPGA
jgi:hypothetical protein